MADQAVTHDEIAFCITGGQSRRAEKSSNVFERCLVERDVRVDGGGVETVFACTIGNAAGDEERSGEKRAEEGFLHLKMEIQ